MSPLLSRPSLFRPARADFPKLRQLAAGWAVLLFLTGPAAALAADAPARPGKTLAPVATRTVAPEHPPELKAELANGEVMLECLVDEDGEVSDITIVAESRAGFGAAAEEALQQWKFQPGTVDGEPRGMRIKVPFEFRLSPDQVLGIIAGRDVYAEITETIIPAQQMPAWPRPIEFYVPRYPPELEGTGKYGKAVVNITIDQEGKVMNPRLVKSTYPEFIIPALVTALKLKFPPQVMADGKTIYVNLDIQFDFKPPAKSTSGKPGKEPKPRKEK